MELNLETYNEVMEALPIGCYLVDRERRIVFWNGAAQKISGYLGQEVIGRLCPDNILMHCDQEYRMLCGADCPMAHTMLDGSPRNRDLFLRHKKGHRVPVRVRSAAIRNSAGAIVGSAEFFEERCFRAADSGLPNPIAGGEPLDEVMEIADQHAMRAALQNAMEQLASSQEPFGILCMAVDRLDHLLHTYGLAAAHAVLHAAAQTVAGNIRPSDIAGRWVGSHFMILASCPSSAGLLSCAERLIRLVDMTAVPWWGDRISVTVSAGGTMARDDDTVETLADRALQALQNSQTQKDNCAVVV